MRNLCEQMSSVSALEKEKAQLETELRNAAVQAKRAQDSHTRVFIQVNETADRLKSEKGYTLG